MKTAQTHVYYNLHRACWSLMLRGKVTGHALSLLITGPDGVRFVVREGGRRRVLAEGRKNVHAFVVGNAEPTPIGLPGMLDETRWVAVTYRPTSGATFTRKDTGEAVTGARAVYMTADRRVLALDPR